MGDLRDLVAHEGANDVAWQDPNLPDHPLTLRSARPRSCDATSPVLFVHHGMKRNGADYRDYWLKLVDEAGLLAVVPEFSEAAFPGSQWYNYGNRTDDRHRQNPRAQWTYGIDGRLFAALRAAGVTQRDSYAAWGHSAGGQFVHRMVSLGFTERLALAVSANAGTYAMPTQDIDFPYGLGGTDADLPALLRFRLMVMAGTADTDTTASDFPKGAHAMAQGPTRYARAHAYLDAGRRQAASLGVPFGWAITDVPDVGHDGERMSQAAAPPIAAALRG
ncbi:MAG: alpha/beta hydrolase [Acidisphaera sp.]|nr:alpha/beta hydrolase [Acidisphaera sp.]MBV9812089.1 alpha/beta hydrolase [Acetobacteraceae bacterium]